MAARGVEPAKLALVGAGLALAEPLHDELTHSSTGARVHHADLEGPAWIEVSFVTQNSLSLTDLIFSGPSQDLESWRRMK